MQTISTVGLDIAKSVFQVHGVDATGQVVIRCRAPVTSCDAAIGERLATFGPVRVHARSLPRLCL
jgi:transposase